MSTSNPTSVLAAAVTGGNPRAIARAATLIENESDTYEALLCQLWPHTGRAEIFGITGAPGAGKSTFVSALVQQLRGEGRTVAVIAIDPTSPFSGGAILGDRIRMQQHHSDPGVFIRSMATRGQLGGLAAATMDLTLLFDAAGYNTVLIETVGVGQDEVEVANLAEATAVVLVPGMGDDIQAIKAGVLEIADTFVLNKSDLPGADRLEKEIQMMLSLAHRPDNWVPPIVRAVATEGQGIAQTLAALRSFVSQGNRKQRAALAWTARLRLMLAARLLQRLPLDRLQYGANEVASRKRDPYSVVNEWLDQIYY